uniref:non-specific serine/threonine protein kinase n=1 Tax=Oryza meridionalis TaxID=40149 RepID=A0A0E0F8T9_9ORYZ
MAPAGTTCRRFWISRRSSPIRSVSLPQAGRRTRPCAAGSACRAAGGGVGSSSCTSLQGELTPHLGNLSFLRVLDLAAANLTGPIPANLGRLRRLKILDLAHNTLSDAIPSALGNLTKLETLNLYDNHFSGHVPMELQNLYSLRVMALDQNYLTGPIPKHLFDAKHSLTHIYLGDNSLSGPIPDSVASLSMLRVLSLPSNQLSGPVPPAIFNMSRLETISIRKNNLTGAIPTNESFNLRMLRKIDLYMNKFTGPIPSGLASCKHLEMISLGDNLFEDVVPAWLATLSQLNSLSLGSNELVGPIPGQFGNLSMLNMLDLSFSKLSGPIPVELGMLSQLTFMSLSNNQLNGTFPAFIGNLSELSHLELAYNQLTGHVPSTIGNNIRPLKHFEIRGNHLHGDLRFLSSLSNSQRLEVLIISENLFTGCIPNSVGNLSTGILEFRANNNRLIGGLPAILSNLTNLRWINFADNQLSKPILPASLVTLENLLGFDLSKNSIAGPIPKEVSMLTRLVCLFLSDNKLSGSIPDGIGNLTMLEHIHLSNNKLSSIVPTSIFHLNNLILLLLFNNALTGALPSDLSHFQNIDHIDVSDNMLDGQLPNSYAYHPMLTYLNLSHNSFRDSIPYSFSHLTNLATLDLSYNNLSGTIPKYLANLTFLTSLNLSFNNLQGQIPSGGVFSNITLQSLMGNARLCGAQHLGFPACLEKSHSTRRKHLLKIVLPAVIAAFGAIVVLLYLMIGKKMKNPDITASFDTADAICHRLVSYQEIVRATENFNEDYLLGVGSFGKVFKGRLDDGLVVAIKILNMQVERAIRSFDAECHVLRMARHRNLIKILNTCSNLDFRALFLQFMPNGNLESYLHSESRPCVGSFLKRMEIMLDVSMAMEYLHHEHHEVVLHCDLKPSNVLFDEEMTAHIADFGIAKMLLEDDNSAVSASMPGTIGYMAPEYAFMGKASRKSDVFSFGIMVLEVFTGKRPTDPMFIGGLTLRLWVSQSFPENLINVADEHLLQDEETRICFDHQNTSLGSSSTSRSNSFLTSIFELGLLCSSESPEQRMAMNDAVSKLKGIKKDYSASMLEMQRRRQY